MRTLLHSLSSLIVLGIFFANAPIEAATILPGSTTTVTLTNPFGGCTGATGPDCTHDGDVSGAGGTFVEWNHSGLTNTDIFTYTFNADYTLIGFSLWNDRGTIDSGIGMFDLVFKDSSNFPIGLPYSNTASLPGSVNSPTPEVFNFAPVPGVRSVDLVVNSSLAPVPGTGNTQFREIEFRSQIPEPATGLLMVIGLGTIVLRRR